MGYGSRDAQRDKVLSDIYKSVGGWDKRFDKSVKIIGNCPFVNGIRAGEIILLASQLLSESNDGG